MVGRGEGAKSYTITTMGNKTQQILISIVFIEFTFLLTALLQKIHLQEQTNRQKEWKWKHSKCELSSAPKMSFNSIKFLILYRHCSQDKNIVSCNLWGYSDPPLEPLSYVTVPSCELQAVVFYDTTLLNLTINHTNNL